MSGQKPRIAAASVIPKPARESAKRTSSSLFNALRAFTLGPKRVQACFIRMCFRMPVGLSSRRYNVLLRIRNKSSTRSHPLFNRSQFRSQLSVQIV